MPRPATGPARVADRRDRGGWRDHRHSHDRRAAAVSVRTTTVPIASVPAPKADSAECRALLDAHSRRFRGLSTRAGVRARAAGAAAWTAGGEPIILRCGMDRPAEFVVGSPIQVVDEVQWFKLSDQGRSTWFAVDRPVYVALTLPQGPARRRSKRSPTSSRRRCPPSPSTLRRSASLARAGAAFQRRLDHGGQQRRIVDAAGRPHPWIHRDRGEPGHRVDFVDHRSSSVRKKSTRARPWQSTALNARIDNWRTSSATSSSTLAGTSSSAASSRYLVSKS